MSPNKTHQHNGKIVYFRPATLADPTKNVDKTKNGTTVPEATTTTPLPWEEPLKHAIYLVLNHKVDGNQPNARFVKFLAHTHTHPQAPPVFSMKNHKILYAVAARAHVTHVDSIKKISRFMTFSAASFFFFAKKVHFLYHTSANRTFSLFYYKTNVFFFFSILLHRAVMISSAEKQYTRLDMCAETPKLHHPYRNLAT